MRYLERLRLVQIPTRTLDITGARVNVVLLTYLYLVISYYNLYDIHKSRCYFWNGYFLLCSFRQLVAAVTSPDIDVACLTSETVAILCVVVAVLV